jgi:hypothetical protein
MEKRREMVVNQMKPADYITLTDIAVCPVG